MATDVHTLPADLPVPQDDGAADHLRGAAVPAIALAATDGGVVDLASLAETPAVLFFYPRTGEAGRSAGPAWDAIPGARGCTPQSCAFRDHHRELADLGAEVYGLSTQTTDYQREMAERLHLPFEVLSDDRLAFARALDLPTFEVAGMTLIRRLTLIVTEGMIEKVLYPVFPPDLNADEVIVWLLAHPRRPETVPAT
jgi:peroxiredoxin